MTDLKNRLESLLADEPAPDHGVDGIVARGRSALRRRRVFQAATGTAAAAAVAAAIVVPVTLAGNSGGAPARVTVATPAATHRVTSVTCHRLALGMKVNSPQMRKILRGLKPPHGQILKLRAIAHRKDGQVFVRYCVGPLSKNTKGQTWPPASGAGSSAPLAPPYTYTEDPAHVADRLAAEVHQQLSALGLDQSYQAPWGQESNKVDAGSPSYYDGATDIREQSGYGDVDVQVRHESTSQETPDGSCDGQGFADCQRTKLADGSVLQTSRMRVGKDGVILVAEDYRPDGVVVHAQESNYAFGPDAGSEAYGDQPMSLDQLVALAEDPKLTF